MPFAQVEKRVIQKQQARNQFPKHTSQRHTMPLSHFTGGNMWVLKTTAMNRGRGIHVFKSMKQLRQILKQTILDYK